MPIEQLFPIKYKLQNFYSWWDILNISGHFQFSSELKLLFENTLKHNMYFSKYRGCPLGQLFFYKPLNTQVDAVAPSSVVHMMGYKWYLKLQIYLNQYK